MPESRFFPERQNRSRTRLGRPKRRDRGPATALCLAFLTAALSASPAGANTATVAPQMSLPRAWHTATLLGDGRVLVAGGTGLGGVPLASAEIFDPLRGAWSATASMSAPRSEHTATLLPSGKVLVAGGLPASAAAEIWDPVAGSWTALSGFPSSLQGHTATLLKDGSVLLAVGGSSWRFLPGSGSLEPAVAMVRTRYRHMAALLPDGRVLAIGGHDASQQSLDVGELYDPATNGWSATGQFSINPVGWDGSATVIADGRVLIHSGRGPAELNWSTYYFNPLDGSFGAATNQSPRFSQQSATLLPSGKILTCGGASDLAATVPIRDCHFFFFESPELAPWFPTTPLTIPRLGHTATLLADGRVLLAGGYTLDPAYGIPSPNTEYFNPGTTSSAVGRPVREDCGSTGGRPLILLPDGRVLVAGPNISFGPSFTWSAATREECSPTAPPDIEFVPGSLNLLNDGRVLAAGGFDEAGSATSASALFSPSTNGWTSAAPMASPRKDHEAVVLANGWVLVAGGTDLQGQYVTTAEMYVPAADAWLPAGELTLGRTGHRLLRLRDGRVLMVGGSHSGAPVDLCEIFDLSRLPAPWRMTGATRSPRNAPTLSMLHDGRVLVAGGAVTPGQHLATTEIFDPVSERWTSGPGLLEARAWHSATTGTDGRIVLLGGRTAYPQYAEALDPVAGVSEEFQSAALGNPRSVALPGGSVLHCPAGRVDLPGGYECIEFRRGDFLPSLQPTLTSVPLIVVNTDPVPIEGTGLGGVSEGSSGSRNASPADHPILELRSLVNEDVERLSLAPIPSGSFRNEPLALTVSEIPARLDRGWYFLTAYTLGIPSESRIVRLDCGVKITSQPQSISVAPGERATFTVVARGARSYSWQRDVTGPDKDDFVDIPGATGSAYATDPVVGPESGYRYRVVVSGCDPEELFSEPATLTVQDLSPPVAAVESPAGGEFWPLSTIDLPQKRLVAWSMADDVRICRVAVRMLHSDDGGLSWSETDPAGGLPAEFGPGGPCMTPVTTTSVLYSIPKAFPSGRTGSLYKVEISVTDAAGNTTTAASPSPFHIVSPSPEGVRTLILAHPARMQAVAGVSPSDAAGLMAKLRELSGHPRVQGVVLDLGQVTTLESLYAAWDLDPGDPVRANELLFAAGGIHAYVRSLLAVYSGVENLVLVGDDRIVPFARVTDRTVLLLEGTYVAGGNLTGASTVGKALAANRYLSDDPLAVKDVVSPYELNGNLFLPDLSVGRLVETPQEITRTVAAFIAQDGVLDLNLLDPLTGHKVLVTGYDFLSSAAREARKRWKAALGVSTPNESLAPVDGSLIGDTWDLTSVSQRVEALRAHLGGNGGSRYGIMSISGHATHFEEGVPGTDPHDIQGLSSRDIFGPDTCESPGLDGLALAGGTVFAIGCHGGLPVPGSCRTDDDRSLDLPQTMMARGVVAYVANTGYGWGLKHGIGYGARLTQILNEELTADGTTTQSLGRTLARTKMRYFLETPRYDPYDEKTLMQWTLYGLPMYALRTGAQAAPSATGLGDATQGAATGSASSLGAVRVRRSVQALQATPLPSYLTRLDLSFDLSAPGVYVKRGASGEELPPGPGCADPNGCYYTLNGLVDRGTGTGDLPIQPYLIYDSRLSGTSQHGVLWKGGEYLEEDGFRFVFGELVSNGGDGSDHGSIARLVMTRPTDPRWPLTTAGCAATDHEVSSLTVTTGEALKRSDSDPEFDVSRRYLGVDVEVFYFNNHRLPGENCDRAGPTLTAGAYGGSYHDFTTDAIAWGVPATDASGVWRVVVVYTDNTVDGDGKGRWRPLDLVDDGTGVFRGQAPVASEARLTYVIQAVDRKGNVSWSLFQGAQLPSSGVPLSIPQPFDATAPAAPDPPKATVSGGGSICPGQSASVQAELTGSAPWSLTWSDGLYQDAIATSPATRSVSPAATLVYTVTLVRDSRTTGTASGSATVTVVRPPDIPKMSAPPEVVSGATGLVASVESHAGAGYAWEITNGTITAGQGTHEIAFTAGSAGTLSLRVVETSALGCASPQASQDVAVLPALAGLSLYVVTPCRAVNTRWAAAPLGGPILGAGETRVFPVLSSTCGIRAGAKVLSINVTVTQTSAGGYLTVYPADGPRPATSTVNYGAGQTRANNAILALSADGHGNLAVFNGSTGSAHVLVDVNGSFE